MFHNFKYTLKILLKNKMLVFWTLLFPIILGTLFNMAFMDIENSEHFKAIDIAVVLNEEYQNDLFFKESLEALSDEENPNQIFHIQYVDLQKAKSLLANSKITGYLEWNPEIKLSIFKNGVNETIFKQVIEEIQTKKQMFEITLSNNMESLNKPNINISEFTNQIIQNINKQYPNIKDVSSKNLSYTMIEFYTLIAMTSLYGAILSLTVTNYNLTATNRTSSRILVSKMSKLKILISSFLATYLVQVMVLLLLYLYTIFVLQVDYGSHIFLIILLSLVGSLAGLALGFFVGTLKVNENLKMGIVIAYTMLGSFLSGMMGITMKYVVDKNIPIINQLNPVNMITDGLYALYYYGISKRYFWNLISLLIFSIILIVLSLIKLRRQKYDSI